MKADAILMHRTRNVIALRAANGDNTIVQVSFFSQITRHKFIGV